MSSGWGGPAADAAETASAIAYLARVLKTPTIGRMFAQLGDTARTEGWTHEAYLAAVLARQVADREASGTALRMAGAHFPAVKTLEDFNPDHQPALRRDVLAHLASSAFVARAENVILLGPPGVGKTHLAIGLGVKAAQAGHPILFDTATGWINRLAAAHSSGRLEQELKTAAPLPAADHRRGRLPAFRRRRGEPVLPTRRFPLRARLSVLVTSNLPFGRWGETFADDVIAAAMIDRLVHHAEVLTLGGESYRTRTRRQLLATGTAPPGVPPDASGTEH